MSRCPRKACPRLSQASPSIRVPEESPRITEGLPFSTHGDYRDGDRPRTRGGHSPELGNRAPKDYTRPIAERYDIESWPAASIRDECRAEYGEYLKARDAHYAAYLEAHPEKRGDHEKKVKDLEASLPDGLGFLAEDLPPSERHQHVLSCKSSQGLALGLLGSARRADPSLSWLVESLRPAPPSISATNHPKARLEQTVAPELLNERPRQTAIDFLVEGEDAVICIEAKWTEAGFGGCSCEGDPLKRQCKAAMDDRVLYWDAAAQEMNLPARFATEVCPISVSYQAVRNVAAAKALAGDDRIPVFALLYDDRNPYFSGAGDWPGWSAVLDDAINEKGQGRVRFASATWQSLAKNLSAAAAVSEWARDKHQLDT